MSLSAIQDNLVKINMVQHTQTKTDDVARGQEIARTQDYKETTRQGDEVVLMTQQKEQEGVREDEDREKDQRRKKKREEDEENEERGKREKEDNGDDNAPRARMRRLNIIA